MTDEHVPSHASLTPVQRRRLAASLAIDDTPTERVAFQHTVLCQTCLPYRDPGDAVRLWEREQGRVSLLVEAGRVKDPTKGGWIEVGLPYGPKPRLILAHLNGEALRTGSPEIEVEKSLTAFVRRIGLSGHGRDVRTVKDQLTRLAAANIRMSVAYSAEHARQVQAHIVSGFDLWFPKNEHQRVLWPTQVRLSSDYFESLQRHAVPLDERALGALSHSAMALDVYAWLAQRLHRIEQGTPQLVNWKALQEQFGWGYSTVRKFRQVFRQTLDLVLSQYRAARIELVDEGMELHHSLPPVAGRIALIPGA
jgi:Plasmid encoded RepA protein